MTTYMVTCTRETNADGTPYTVTYEGVDRSEAERRAAEFPCEAEHTIEEVT